MQSRAELEISGQSVLPGRSVLPEPQDGKRVTLLSLGAAQSEGNSSAFLKAGNLSRARPID